MYSTQGEGSGANPIGAPGIVQHSTSQSQKKDANERLAQMRAYVSDLALAGVGSNHALGGRENVDKQGHSRG